MKEENKKVETENIENKQKNQNEKIGFFKKVWYSITKIEKYPDMSAQGFGKAMGYVAKLIAILTIVVCIGMMYQTYELIQKGENYLQNDFPEFSYKDGILNIESENEIIIQPENSVVGKAIIDTKTEDEQKINQYINDITESGEGIIVLKEKVIVSQSSVAGTITYSYKDLFEKSEINEFTKQDVINYINGSEIINVYISVFLTMFVYIFIMYLITTLSNAVLLSAFGYLTTLLARIKMRYVAVFNMSVYALTLPVILNIIYIAINIFVPFNMQYFQVMYIAIAVIYLVSAILILKTEIM